MSKGYNRKIKLIWEPNGRSWMFTRMTAMQAVLYSSHLSALRILLTHCSIDIHMKVERVGVSLHINWCSDLCKWIWRSYLIHWHGSMGRFEKMIKMDSICSVKRSFIENTMMMKNYVYSAAKWNQKTAKFSNRTNKRVMHENYFSSSQLFIADINSKILISMLNQTNVKIKVKATTRNCKCTRPSSLFFSHPYIIFLLVICYVLCWFMHNCNQNWLICHQKHRF